MKKIITAVLIFVLVLSLAVFLSGCSENKLIGKWETTVNMDEYFNSYITEQNEEFSKYLEIDGFELVYYVEYSDDDTYKTYLDKDVANSAIAQVEKTVRAGMDEYFKLKIKEQGLDMTVDEILELKDTSFDALLEDIFNDGLIDSLNKLFENEGKFKAEDGKLFLSDGADKKIDSEAYETYEISGDTLKILGSFVGEEKNESEVYPKVFKKVS